MYVLFYWGGAEVARGANNSEDVGSNPTSGIYHSSGFTESATAVTTATLHRLSSSVERRAHNPEVTGSTPVGGIYHLSALQKPMVIVRATLNTSTLFTGMAQRQRARLITSRTQDRSLLPVFIISRVYRIRHAVTTATIHPLSSAGEHPGS